MSATIQGMSRRGAWWVVWLACWGLGANEPEEVEVSRTFRTVCTLDWDAEDDLTVALLSADGALILTGACDVNHGASQVPPSTPKEVKHPLINISGRFPEVFLWDAESGKKLRVFKGHSTPVGVLAFSPNGRTVASGGAEEYVGIHKLRPPEKNQFYTGRELGTRPAGGLIKVLGRRDRA